MGAEDLALLVALSLLWGGSFFFVGVAVAELPTFTIVALRVLLATLALLLFLKATGTVIPASAEAWRAFAVMGVLNNVIPFSLIVWGQAHIASGLASILNATTPLFTVAVAHWLTGDEKLTPSRASGVAIGFAGVVVMIGPAALEGFGTDLLAQLACLAAALSYAFAGVFGRRFRALGLAPLQTALGQVAASSVLLVPLALLADRPWTLPAPGPATWLSVIGLAVLSTALAYGLYFRILARAGATNVLLVTFLVPVSAILLGALVLGERLQARHFAGMALIAAGLAAIDGRLIARWRGAGAG
ncbi:MAG TPA: DMT family transporter [Alphaproteobacteria bacterium]|nr:DMT family transporter [Alphaproteobacteria bacterium]